jgi:hypothetical protein
MDCFSLAQGNRCNRHSKSQYHLVPVKKCAKSHPTGHFVALHSSAQAALFAAEQEVQDWLAATETDLSAVFVHFDRDVQHLVWRGLRILLVARLVDEILYRLFPVPDLTQA